MDIKNIIPKEHMPPRLSKDNVPEKFWHLIPLAEKYGVTDDGYRSDLVKSLSQVEKDKLASFLEEYDDGLDEWLAGPESNGPDFSDEYVAFSALRIAADESC